MKARAAVSVEQLETKLALSGVSGHLQAAAVGHGATLHVEAVPNPYVVSGTFTYYGSSDRKVFLTAPKDFVIPNLGVVKLSGADSGGKGDKVNVTALLVTSRVGVVKINLLPLVTFQPGVSGPYHGSYSFSAGGVTGNGKVDFSLTGNQGFTFDFLPLEVSEARSAGTDAADSASRRRGLDVDSAANREGTRTGRSPREYPTMRRIAILNQKGGVGKTTSTVNLAAALANEGKKTLVLDLDPQAHATLHLGLLPGRSGPSLYDVLTQNVPLADARRQVAENLYIVGSHIDLAAAEVELIGMVGREMILRDQLEADPEEFDYILMDCPPSLGILTLNALCAAREVIIPLQAHFLALHGLSKLLETIHLVSKRVNRDLKVAGVVLCLYDAGTRLGGEVIDDLDRYFDGRRLGVNPWSEARVYQTRIRRNIRLAECPSFGQSIFQYAPSSRGAEDYAALAAEIQGKEPATVPAAEEVSAPEPRKAVDGVSPTILA